MTDTEKEFNKLSMFIEKQIDLEMKGKGRCDWKLFQDIQIDAFKFVLKKMDKMQRRRT